jgi:putative endonuclease
MFHVYILASINRVLYVGSTDDLARRVHEHKKGRANAFTTRYRVNRLVYYEPAESRIAAVQRELEIKPWRREKKIALIESMNPSWRDNELEPPARPDPSLTLGAARFPEN